MSFGILIRKSTNEHATNRNPNANDETLWQRVKIETKRTTSPKKANDAKLGVFGNRWTHVRLARRRNTYASKLGVNMISSLLCLSKERIQTR